MKKSIFTVITVAALTAATAAPSLAAVNCGLVNRDLELGRKPDDIAERMGISVADVQSCKAKGNNATSGGPANPPKPTTPAGVQPSSTGNGSK